MMAKGEGQVANRELSLLHLPFAIRYSPFPDFHSLFAIRYSLYR